MKGERIAKRGTGLRIGLWGLAFEGKTNSLRLSGLTACTSTTRICCLVKQHRLDAAFELVTFKFVFAMSDKSVSDPPAA